MKIDVNGLKLNCRIEGPADAPCITLGHALANNLTLWDDQVALLKGRYRVLRYDQRGHGQSEAVPGPYSFAMLIGDVWAATTAASHQSSAMLPTHPPTPVRHFCIVLPFFTLVDRFVNPLQVIAS